jgi:O-antigen/teichoic acid export membrane protein
VRKPLGALTRNVAIYGAGDVAITAVGILLLPVYLKYLQQEGYGALALLIGVEALTKILFRWGLDGAFMRYYHDCETPAERVRLTSTICLFLLLASGTMLLIGLAASGAIADHLFEQASQRYLTPLRLVLINTFLLTFTFVPYQVMRLEKQALTFSVISFLRTVATLVLKLWLVVGVGWGLTGFVAADIIVTLGLLPILWPWTRPLLGAVFSVDELRRCLRFGLPRLPHGLAQQSLDAGNKYLLNQHVPLASLGVYNISSSIGQSLKLFLSAFETGWAPFYYETARQPDAQMVFAKITTYGIAILALLVAGLTAITPDLIHLLTISTPWTNEAYAQTAVVVPLIALGIAFQGVYLLTSIGLNLTSQTQYYPVAAFAAAGVGLGSGVILMPRFGAVGAAVAFLLSYITLAATAAVFAQRHYAVHYEGARLIRVLVAATLAMLAGVWLPDMPHLAGFLARGTSVAVVFVGLLWLTGFLRPTERAILGGVARRLAGRTLQ